MELANNNQLSLLNIIERKEILENSLEDFEAEMDRIKALPEKEWWKLFKIEK